eukprot:TRINITY_DN483_c0_g1_i2.p1 TRINITY_DN483_c0_g1~~TRINITY_DN483_c0_g1_i2.p1  ORF type:complete len:2113 (+),score=684.84 TRINITY_DN483_c0_g1_i2:42-6341(+)
MKATRSHVFSRGKGWAASLVLVTVLALLVLLAPEVEADVISTNSVCNCKNNLVPYFRIFEGSEDYDDALHHDDDDQLCGKRGKLATIRSKAEHDCMVSAIFDDTYSNFYWLGGRQPDESSPFTWDCQGKCDYDGVPFYDEDLSPGCLQKFCPFSPPEPNNDGGSEQCMNLHTQVPGPLRLNDDVCTFAGSKIVSYYVYSEYIEPFLDDGSFLTPAWSTVSSLWGASGVTSNTAIRRVAGSSAGYYLKSFTTVKDRFMSFDINYYTATPPSVSQFFGFAIGPDFSGSFPHLLFEMNRNGAVTVTRVGTPSETLLTFSSGIITTSVQTYRIFFESKAATLRVWISANGGGGPDDYTSFTQLAGVVLTGTAITTCEPAGASCPSTSPAFPTFSKFAFYTRSLSEVQFSDLNDYPFVGCSGTLSFTIPYSFCPAPSGGTHTVHFEANGVFPDGNTPDTLNGFGEGDYTYSLNPINAVPGIYPVSFTISALGSYSLNSRCVVSGSTTRTRTENFFILISGGAPSCVASPVNVILGAGGTATPAAASFVMGSSCLGTPSISPSTFTCAMASTNVPVTVSFTGGSCIASASVSDTTPPTVSCNSPTLTITSGSTVTLTEAQIVNTKNDNCGPPTAFFSSAFSCANVGTPSSVVVTVSDASGNTRTCTGTVTVVDDVDPVVTCNTAFSKALSGTSLTLIESELVASKSDNCGTATISFNPTYTCSNIGVNSVTVTANDGRGNTASCSVLVTVQDTTSPTVTCNNPTLNLSAGGTYTATESDLVASKNDNCGPVTASFTAAFTCAHVAASPVSVPVTVNDGSGQSASCTSQVTVRDITPPSVTCRGSFSTNLDASGNALVTESDLITSKSDNCGAPTTSFTSSFTCANIGTNTVTVTANDGHGNTASCNIPVTITDNIPPSVTCRPSLTVNLNSGGTATIIESDVVASKSDNCGTPTTSFTSSFTCANIGTNMITVTANDGNGNTATCNIPVTVVDDVDPTITCDPVFILNLGNDGTGTVTESNTVDAKNDNCGTPVVTISPKDFDCSQLSLSPYTVTSTATDSQGNSASCTTDVYVTDISIPDLSCPSSFTIDLDNDSTSKPVNFGTVTSDNCPLDPLGVQITPNTVTCADAGTTVVATSSITSVFLGPNSIAFCNTNVNVRDTSPPHANCLGPQIMDLPDVTNPGLSVLGNVIAAASTDNCDTSLSFSPTTRSFGCSDRNAPVTVTFTVTDNRPNSATCDTQFTIRDVSAPHLSCIGSYNADLDGSGAASITPGTLTISESDNCLISSRILSQSSFTCSDILAPVDVSLTLSDGFQTTDCTVSVTIRDLLPPVASCASLTYSLSQDLTLDTLLLVSGTTDNCLSEGLTVDPATLHFECTDLGDNMIDLTVFDQAGNSDECTTTITIVDDVPPVARCVPSISFTITPPFNYTAFISPLDVDAGSADNCMIEDYILTGRTIFDTTGVYDVVMTVIDAANNFDTCRTSVLVYVAPPSVTPTASNTKTQSGSRSFSVTPTHSKTPSPTRAATKVSESRTQTASSSRTPSHSESASKTASRSNSVSPSLSASISFSRTVSESPTQTATGTRSLSATRSPSPSLSATRTMTSSGSGTRSLSGSVTPSPTFVPPSETPSPSSSISASRVGSLSRTATKSVSETRDPSATRTGKPTSSPDPQVPSLSTTRTPTATSTKTPTNSRTPSATLDDHSLSSSETRMPSSSPSVSKSLSTSRSPSATMTPSVSFSRTVSQTRNPSQSATQSKSMSETRSPSSSPDPTRSPKSIEVPSLSRSPSPKTDPSRTPSPSNTLTPTKTPTPTHRESVTASPSVSGTRPSSESKSSSITSSPSGTPSNTRTPSRSESMTRSETHSPSPTHTPSHTSAENLSCRDVDCGDDNPCTIDFCEVVFGDPEKTFNCRHLSAEEGSSCPLDALNSNCWSRAECDGNGKCTGFDFACRSDDECYEAFCDKDTLQCNRRIRESCGILQPSFAPIGSPGPTPPGPLPPQIQSPAPSKSYDPNRAPLALTGVVTKTATPTSKDGKKGKDTQNKVLENSTINWTVSGIGVTMIACAGCCAIIFGMIAAKKNENHSDRLTSILDADLGANDVFSSGL